MQLLKAAFFFWCGLNVIQQSWINFKYLLGNPSMTQIKSTDTVNSQYFLSWFWNYFNRCVKTRKFFKSWTKNTLTLSVVVIILLNTNVRKTSSEFCLKTFLNLHFMSILNSAKQPVQSINECFPLSQAFCLAAGNGIKYLERFLSYSHYFSVLLHYEQWHS